MVLASRSVPSLLFLLLVCMTAVPQLRSAEHLKVTVERLQSEVTNATSCHSSCVRSTLVFDFVMQVSKTRKSVEEQRIRVKADEEEMMAKKKELNQIRCEESNLQSKLAIYKKEMEQMSCSSSQMQLQISQVKALLVALEEYEIQVKEGTADLQAAVAANDLHKLNTLLCRPISPPPEIQLVSPILMFPRSVNQHAVTGRTGRGFPAGKRTAKSESRPERRPFCWRRSI